MDTKQSINRRLLDALVRLEYLAAPHIAGPGGECPGLTMGEQAVLEARAAIQDAKEALAEPGRGADREAGAVCRAMVNAYLAGEGNEAKSASSPERDGSKDGSLRSERVLVFGNRRGEPDFCQIICELTQDGLDLGDHYGYAEAKAESSGFERPFVCFDITESRRLIRLVPYLSYLLEDHDMVVEQISESAIHAFARQENRFPVDEWRLEVANGDTLLGYYDWVSTNVLVGIYGRHSIMKPGHLLWEVFCNRLSGPDGCDFKEDAIKGTVWRCDHGFSKSSHILGELGVNVAKTLVYFRKNGVFCDCEVLLNTHILEGAESESDSGALPEKFQAS